MKLPGLLLLTLICVCAEAQENARDPKLYPYVRAPLQTDDVVGDIPVLNWRAFSSVSELQSSVLGQENRVNQKFAQSPILVVTVSEPSPAAETIDRSALSRIRVISGRAYQDEGSQDVLFVGCVTDDCKSHRAIVRTTAPGGVSVFRWKGLRYSVRTETFESLVQGLKLEQGQKIHVNRWHQIVVLSASPVRHVDLYRYLMLAGASDKRKTPSPEAHARETPVVALDRAGWIRIPSRKYEKISRAFFE